MSATLGIIGTAGRGEDAALLTANHWRSMLTVAQIVAEVTGATRLVSGGAAWADALAVELYLRGQTKELSLHLPARFDTHDECPRYDNADKCGAVSNSYHKAFTKVTGYDGLTAIAEALGKGCHNTQPSVRSTSFGAFFLRNALVVDEASVMLAFTFGNGVVLKDGGTAHTMSRFLARRRANEEQSALRGLSHNSQGPGAAYHFCMKARRLYTLP